MTDKIRTLQGRVVSDKNGEIHCCSYRTFCETPDLR